MSGHLSDRTRVTGMEGRASSKRLSPRFQLGRMLISVLDMERCLQSLDDQIRSGRSGYVCVANVEATVLAQRDPEFCRIQNESLLTVADGMPLIWYARMAGERGLQRITGPDLMMEVLRISAERGYTHYFYGDTEETLEKIRQVISDRYPGTKIVGMHSPPFRRLTNEEIGQVVHEINRLRPSFVWVGLGCPKQERWVGEVSPRIESSILIGVGAAFRFMIGQYRHPHRIVQVLGLEGIFWRVRQRPGYVLKWYAWHVPAYSVLFFKGLIKRIVAGSSA